MMGYGGYGLFGGLGMGIGVLFWVIVVALIAWALISFFGSRPGVPDETPLEILKRRYATGEIDEAEFERARQRIS